MKLLVLLNQVFGQWSPKTARSAAHSFSSPARVPVAWVLTMEISSGASPARFRAPAMH
jgi:hypothetical protein